MCYLIRFHFPFQSGNAVLRDLRFGERFREILSDMQAEAAHFTAVEGQRGGYIVVNFHDASKRSEGRHGSQPGGRSPEWYRPRNGLYIDYARQKHVRARSPPRIRSLRGICLAR